MRNGIVARECVQSWIMLYNKQCAFEHKDRFRGHVIWHHSKNVSKTKWPNWNFPSKWDWRPRIIWGHTGWTLTCNNGFINLDRTRKVNRPTYVELYNHTHQMSHVANQMPHVTHHTSNVTCHTSHMTLVTLWVNLILNHD